MITLEYSHRFSLSQVVPTHTLYEISQPHRHTGMHSNACSEALVLRKLRYASVHQMNFSTNDPIRNADVTTTPA